MFYSSTFHLERLLLCEGEEMYCYTVYVFSASGFMSVVPEQRAYC